MKPIIILLFSLLAAQIKAQDTSAYHYTIAADLSPFAFNGYSIKGGFITKNLSKTEFAFEIFSMEIPDVVINLNKSNANKGWYEKVKLGNALYVDKKLGEKRNSFWIGGGLVFLNHEVKNTSVKTSFQQLEYLARINYKYYPFKTANFYINPYIALAGRHKIGGDNGNYSLTPFLLIPSVYLSWQL